MVEPDISVVCDQSKLDKHGCKGAPDLIVEILSPSSLRHDRLVKLNLYQQAGVLENCISLAIDRLEYSCYPKSTLCTAYKSTVQTEQAVMNVMESGHMSGSGFFIHGTVAANTVSWVFFIGFLQKPPHILVS